MAADNDIFRPVHPGEYLTEDVLEDLGISIREVSRVIGVSPNRISQIARGERAITADTALRLGRWLGTSAEFWLKLQMRYDLETAELEVGEQIRREVRPRQGVVDQSELQREGVAAH